ncbi:hypothetical protein Bca4012_031781 [Brassica carinata]|uniref:Uncharacterized protein n=2 Tax=Brassica TaxID=3705 RepID=A0A8X7RFE0_BRACI|nr:hypothetical protein Bca52824_046621 [Brassica carinata]
MAKHTSSIKRIRDQERDIMGDQRSLDGGGGCLEEEEDDTYILLVDINHKAFEEQHLKAREKVQGIQLIEPTTEAFHTADTGSWENVHGRRKGTEVGGSQSHQGSLQKRYADEKGIAVSPSRFSLLQDINEDEEEEKEELLKEVEDGKREGEEKLESSIETMNPFGSFTKERRNGPKAPDTVSFPLEERNLHMVAVSTTSPAAAIPNSPLAALQSPSSPLPPARPSTLRMVAVST